MKLSSLFLPLAAIAIGLSSCSVERTAFVNGSSIEWTKKNNVPVERSQPQAQAQAPAVTTAAFENATAQRAEQVAAPVAAETITAQAATAAAAGKTTRVRPANQVMSANTVAPVMEAEQVKAEAQTWKPVPAKASKKGGGKSQLIALLLCIFLGGLGIHRFYLGYTWQGVVQLLTGGGCGVWALIDLVRIIMGTLEPKNGGYSETL